MTEWIPLAVVLGMLFGLAVTIAFIGSAPPQYTPMTPTEERAYLRKQGMSDAEIDSLIAFCERRPNTLHKCCDECPGDDTCQNARICCCGEDMDKHSLWDGHQATSAHHYYASLREERRDPTAA